MRSINFNFNQDSVSYLGNNMQYQIKLKKNEEGYAVWCPSLPGCASQGETREEALANIRDAIESYLEVLNNP